MWLSGLSPIPAGEVGFRSDIELLGTTPDLWMIAAPLIFRLNGEDITVPVGVVTDLASIPRIADWLPGFQRDGVSRRAAVIHDALYNVDQSRGKDFADNVLRIALMSDGASTWLANTIWAGVHQFGGPAWRSDARGTGGFFTTAYRDAWCGSLFSKV